MNEFRLKATERGFMRGEFRDEFGRHCSLQRSSIMGAPCIWFGIDTDEHGRKVAAVNPDGTPETDGTPVKRLVPCGRMHLSQNDVRALLPALIHFAETGDLPVSTEKE